MTQSNQVNIVSFLRSGSYEDMLQRLVVGLTGRRDLSLRVVQGGEDLAWTDNQDIYVNPSHRLLAPLTLVQQTICNMALVTHECLHPLYTDFSLMKRASRHKNPALLRSVFNTLEDARIERIGAFVFPGIIFGIETLNEIIYEDNHSESSEKISKPENGKEDEELSAFQLLMDNIWSWAVCAKPGYELPKDEKVLNDWAEIYELINTARLSDDCMTCYLCSEKICRILDKYNPPKEIDMPNIVILTGTLEQDSSGRKGGQRAIVVNTGGADFQGDRRKGAPLPALPLGGQSSSNQNSQSGSQSDGTSSSGGSSGAQNGGSASSGGGSVKNGQQSGQEEEDAQNGSGKASDDKSKDGDEGQKGGKNGDKDGDKKGNKNGDKDDDKDGSKQDSQNSEQPSKEGDGKNGSSRLETEKRNPHFTQITPGKGNTVSSSAASASQQPSSSGSSAGSTTPVFNGALAEAIKQALDNAMQAFASEKKDTEHDQKIAQAYVAGQKRSGAGGRLYSLQAYSVVPDSGARAAYDVYRKKSAAVVKRTVAKMKQILNLNQDELLRYQSRGNIDGKSLSRILTGNVCAQRIEKQDESELYVTLLVDMSGSMYGDRREWAILSAVALQEVFELMHIPYATATFSDTFQLFNDSAFRSKKRKLGIARAMCGGGTPLAQALMMVENRLKQVHRDDKLVFVITDGEPNDFNAATELIARLRREGIVVYGFAIGQDGKQVASLFAPDSVAITSLSDLPEQMCKVIKCSLLK